MNDKHLFTLDVVSSIDDDIIDKNLEKRCNLWFKKGKRNPRRWVPIVAAAACLCILISALALLVPGGNGKQVPVYRGMTVSNDPPSVEQAHAPLTYPTFSFLSAPAGPLPSYDISLLGDDDVPGQNKPNEDQDKDDAPGQNKPNEDQDKDDAPGQNKPNEDQGNYDDAPDIVFGQTYYALKNEDIYIHIHLSNPDEFEILSFTLNGKKYSSNMFEYGSDLQTLILKYNVGDVDGLQEYTIDAIKYVDNEKIKNVRMEGDKTVKVFVNDEKDVLQFNASLSFMTLTIAPTKPLLSLALYEGETLLRELSPTDTEIPDLPFDKRLILKATYSDGKQTREAQHIFDTQKLSQGLIIEDGVIRGMGSCTDTVLYINNPVGAEAFAGVKNIVKVYMGSGVTSIDKKAFFECTQLTTVIPSKTLRAIGDSAFSHCKALESITLPESLETIGGAAFSVCLSLRNISIPERIEIIEEHTFSLCSSLENVTLPNHLMSIGNTAFNSCTSLQTITLPASITSIGTHAFCNSKSMTAIHFEGTISEWKRITKAVDWAGSTNHFADPAWPYAAYITVIHCTDGDITLS
ncbi:MAG: leucine-rich repeat domain-containing protein [Ruminococcaceae bacterium]|nr:leucine-rich repeat domain-containing protein [Oscillospiraceae bacterium]